ncbi:helix-turn-helix DNA binding domain protein [Mycobacterium phage Lopton]|nr:helix-turn-helix DNA binding domain protein [Mycobacterium phage Lopton]
MDDLLTNKLIKKAAKSVGNSWLLTSDQVEDLIQDLWVELLERPSRQQAISGVSEDEAVSYLRGHAGQILSVRMREEYLARGDWDYSAESIKDALKGRGDNPFLMEIIPQAIDRLADRHPPYAQALRVRYLDEVIVRDQAAKDRLKNAHKALAEEIHSVIVEMSEHDGPGSRSKVFPDTIRSHNGPGDPVGEMATRLADDGWKSAGEDGLTYRELFDLATAEQVPSSAPKHHRACPVCHHIVPISSGRFRDHLIPSCAGSGAAA